MPRAERDLEAIFLYIRAASSPPADRWFGKLIETITSLSEHPLRDPKTPEDPGLRQLLFGNKPTFTA
jgi:plasmid stabilization system protein ParE